MISLSMIESLEDKVTLIKDVSRIDYLYKESVFLIAQYAEKLLPGIKGHILRTAYYAKLLVLELYKHKLYPEVIDEEFTQMLPCAAALHDIGKLMVPNHIINNKLSLNDEERIIMRKHIDYGNEIIGEALKDTKNIKFLSLTNDVVTYHHERYNGSGYREGLKGEEIPLSARIVAICDIFDAMTSKRGYKDAYTQEYTLNYLKEVSGKEVDPELLKVFLTNEIQEKIAYSIAKYGNLSTPSL